MLCRFVTLKIFFRKKHFSSIQPGGEQLGLAKEVEQHCLICYLSIHLTVKTIFWRPAPCQPSLFLWVWPIFFNPLQWIQPWAKLIGMCIDVVFCLLARKAAFLIHWPKQCSPSKWAAQPFVPWLVPLSAHTTPGQRRRGRGDPQLVCHPNCSASGCRGYAHQSHRAQRLQGCGNRRPLAREKHSYGHLL